MVGSDCVFAARACCSGVGGGTSSGPRRPQELRESAISATTAIVIVFIKSPEPDTGPANANALAILITDRNRFVHPKLRD